jgi:hypothetical protein
MPFELLAERHESGLLEDRIGIDVRSNEPQAKVAGVGLFVRDLFDDGFERAARRLQVRDR